MTPEQLIETIAWYRDFYHQQDFGHAEMIDTLTPLVGKPLSHKELEIVDCIEQTVDGWLKVEEV